MKMRLLVCWALLGLGFVTPCGAQEVEAPAFPYHPGKGNSAEYRGEIQSPSQFFGVPLGSRFTPHHDMLRYCHYVAQSSPRVKITKYGETPQGRDLVLLLIGSPQIINDLVKIRRRQAFLADPRQGADPESLEQLLQKLPAIVWLSYNVHGNEPSPTETALQALYQLTDGTDAVTEKILANTLVIMDPNLNPDGRERYLHWYHSVAAAGGGDPNPTAREHNEPWPGGRSNHYYFDLNRDWAWQSQPETQQRIAAYLKWQPLVHVDYHEMSPESSYFFFPAEDPINTNLPEHTTRWGKIFGRANAEAFDRFGWRYYTGESFDLFYPGYGDTWPSFHGAIGMTYEQAGGPRGGLRYRQRSGAVLTLEQRTHHHYVTTMATLECAADRKDELQRSFFEFRKQAIEVGQKGDIVEFVFPPTENWEPRHELVDLLLRQGVEVEVTGADAIGEALVPFGGTEPVSKRVPRGSYIVSLAQPAGRLARTLLEPHATATLPRFYDVSAWSLPLAMGVEAFHTAKRVPGERSPFPTLSKPEGKVSHIGRYAYLLPWRGTAAARALRLLQAQGRSVSLIPDEIQIGEQKFPRGTLLVSANQDDESSYARLVELARSCNVELYPVASGWTESGIDLGSDQVRELREVRVAVATGSGVFSGSFGTIWSLFERELQLPFTAFDLENMGRLDLAEFDVLVLPDGFGYRRALSETTRESLQDWVRGGGVLIALGGPAFTLCQEATGFTNVTARVEPAKKKPESKPRLKTKELRELRRERQVPGNIFRANLDPEHPIAFGLAEDIHVFLRSTRTFAVTGNGGDVCALTEDPAASGFISDENVGKLKKRIYVSVQRMGRGQVVLFAGDPNFRLFWRGTTPLFLNALFLLSFK